VGRKDFESLWASLNAGTRTSGHRGVDQVFSALHEAEVTRDDFKAAWDASTKLCQRQILLNAELRKVRNELLEQLEEVHIAYTTHLDAIRGALDTEEHGSALVEVARDAHQAELRLRNIEAARESRSEALESYKHDFELLLAAVRKVLTSPASMGMMDIEVLTGALDTLGLQIERPA
jgi:hypothetical protein